MTQQTDFFMYGSRWVRADFHLHTRRDREFSYDGNDSDFVPRYIAALKNAGIGAGVITNHNKFDLDEFRSLRKAAKRENIFLLPGVELSVKDGSNGIHTLVVFSEEWYKNQERKDYIADFLNLAFASQANYENTNSRSNHDIAETIRKLDEFHREYMLIFAHVEGKNGLWRGIDGGRLTELGKNKYFRNRTSAFQKVRSESNRQNVKNWFANWYPAEVEGSDPKSIDEIGQGKKTYVKLGAFTFEALQFALKPNTDRLSSQEVSPQPHSYIQALRFEGGMLDGKRLPFSPEMNCLIGVRGSGKSAVLECLRYALNLPKPETSDEVDLAYKESLVRFALKSGGKVVVEVRDSQGREFEVRRILNERGDVYFDGELQPGIKVPIKNPLFFGQKELVKRGEHSERELVERMIGSKLDPIRKEIQAQRIRVLEVLGNLDKLKNLDELEDEYDSKKKNTEFRLKLFRDYGVEDQLKRQIEFNNDEVRARRAIDAAQSFVRSFDAFLREQETELSAIPHLHSKENSDITGEINKIIDNLRIVPKSVMSILSEAKNDLRLLQSQMEMLKTRRETLKEEFAKTERELSEKLQGQGDGSIRPNDFVKLNNDLQKYTIALAEVAKSRSRRNLLRSELLRELKRLQDLWHEEFRAIEQEVNKLNTSQTALQITPVYKGDHKAMLNELMSSLRGSRLRETTLEGALENHADFISLYEGLDGVCSELGSSGEKFKHYFNEAKESLIVWQVPNTFEIKYHDKDLKEHSLGQRASALILFILSQRDNDLIVIDQPEDDLDNQTIFEDVIKLLRTLKKGIQFIFATHNANFPVLGDSEQVGACTFSAGKGTIVEGSIDQQDIQKRIVSIMEGGKEAFTRRKEIYKLWKQ